MSKTCMVGQLSSSNYQQKRSYKDLSAADKNERPRLTLAENNPGLLGLIILNLLRSD